MLARTNVVPVEIVKNNPFKQILKVVSAGFFIE